ncbi:murein biosynthesis integral membrane protein MurJ [Paenibacillus ihuae]|uniref:murein biosynthesis integral membrane protein MurJ n=1 Tax=Paenibacillus ihuae TaxID=1232431 RepID=UPI0006D53F28|nr:murein biosynthesis integral membrane protein MurJ [Paenibacillus ihuae]
MKKIAIIIMIITIASKLIGLLREVAFAYFFGASYITDAFLISTLIPSVIFSAIVAAISTGFIPMYNKINIEQGERQSTYFTNNLLNFIFILSTLIIIITLLFTKQIVLLFASGFDEKTLNLTILLSRISIIGIYFTALVYLLSGYLQIKQNYIITTLTGIPLSILMIIFLLISHNYGPVFLAIGSVLSIFSQALLLFIFAYKRGYRYKFSFDYKEKNLRALIITIIPVLLGSSVETINKLVDRTVASRISIGGISALNYAHTLNSFVQGIVVSAILTIMYPTISKMAAENNICGVKRGLQESINGVVLLVLPATVGYMIFSEPLVKLLFGRGAFDSDDILLTANVLFYYSIGMIGFGVREIVSTVFYSLQDTKTPMINAIQSMLLNIFLIVILSRYLGISGLALATSISGLFCSLMLIWKLRRKIGSFGLKNILFSMLKAFLASIFMGIACRFLFGFLTQSIHIYLALFISIFFGLVFYLLLIFLFGIRDVHLILNKFRNKFD